MNNTNTKSIKPIALKNINTKIDGITVKVSSTFYTTEGSQQAAAAVQLALKGSGNFSAYVAKSLENTESTDQLADYAISALNECRHNKALDFGFKSYPEMMDSTLSDDIVGDKSQAQYKSSLRSLKVGNDKPAQFYALLKTACSRSDFGIKFDTKDENFEFTVKVKREDTTTAVNKILKMIEKLTEKDQLQLGSALACSNEFQHVKVSTENARVFNASAKVAIAATQQDSKVVKAKTLRAKNADVIKKAAKVRTTPVKSHKDNVDKMGHLGDIMLDGLEVTTVDEVNELLSH